MLLKLNTNPTDRELRQFGLTLIVGFGSIGALLFWRNRPEIAYWMWPISFGIGLLAIVLPKASKIFYLAWMGFAVLMGSIMSRIILTIVFIVIITPVGILFRLLRRDALQLQRKPDSQSYWVELAKITDNSYYKRLF